MKRILALALSLPMLLVAAKKGEMDVRRQCLEELDYIGSVLRQGYACEDLKGENFEWDLESELADAKAELVAIENFEWKDYHRIAKRLLASTRDYHVGIRFVNTERAWLPIEVYSIDDRTYLAAVNETVVDSWRFPFEPGDELLAIDGVPIAELRAELAEQDLSYVNNALTDSRLLDLLITSRSAARAQDVPRGPVTLTMLREGAEKPENAQLIWQYTAEAFPQPGIKKKRATRQIEDLELDDCPLLDRKVRLPVELGERCGCSDYSSWVPELGEVVWRCEDERCLYPAYLYRNDDGKLIGYVRIPWFTWFRHEKLAEHMAYFQKHADALVIDEVDNPGGDPIVMYWIASMLSDKTLIPPTDQYAMEGDLVEWAYAVRTLLTDPRFVDWREEIVNWWLDPLPTDKQTLEFFLEWCRQIIEDFEMGKQMGRPTFLMGVDHIAPHESIRFTKPKLVLANELSFSCGDYFPAILQDNGAAAIFGAPTAGAGGGVTAKWTPHATGVFAFWYTCLISWRPDGRPIENLGVEPSVPYAVTQEDLADNYSGYAQAVNQTLSSMIQEWEDEHADESEPQANAKGLADEDDEAEG